ncbi:hypothetical protein TTHERM_000794051 (macronuclear) [Tetrahymena thermophila SB210]|uniref:Uncharacterized protein n=1 Tax=Tetrahymena thermophila (strain SB210) TaxID=312017 RepID=W7XIC2_TETTS|nr:hypothetical protein TTHERM_000794051 [Tetrahymena thermophila SB210]EWS73169.1 hypothetical protein TTHERM_000794051 [Tetrahymena thermophila SB210]|eukprot:XP_012654289.1 hypothetical protein TTHERM_000794051 [Tetrahymena thermophila SB210]
MKIFEKKILINEQVQIFNQTFIQLYIYLSNYRAQLILCFQEKINNSFSPQRYQQERILLKKLLKTQQIILKNIFKSILELKFIEINSLIRNQISSINFYFK